MDTKRINIWDEGEYSYAAAYGFKPNIRTFIHEDDENRDCMLVVPGGGYCMVVPPEAQIVAERFYNEGMNAFILTYTADITMSVPLKKQPLNDISRAVRVLRANAEEYKIAGKKLIICGFSAGAHVCGSLCTHWQDVDDANVKYAGISNRPDGAILSYPVITTGEYTHIYSIQALLGKEPDESELEYFSLEKQVSDKTPPCFIWQTRTDDLVPVENSYLMADALKAAGVPYAHYVFPHGPHGLSIASEQFFRGQFPDNFTCEQLEGAVAAVFEGNTIDVSQERIAELKEQFSAWNQAQESAGQTKAEEAKSADQAADDQAPADQATESQPANHAPAPELNPFPEVRFWPDMAMCWIRSL